MSDGQWESRSLFGQTEPAFEPAAPDYALPPQPALTVADAPRRRLTSRRGCSQCSDENQACVPFRSDRAQE